MLSDFINHLKLLLASTFGVLDEGYVRGDTCLVAMLLLERP